MTFSPTHYTPLNILGANVIDGINDEDCTLGNCDVTTDATYTIDGSVVVPFSFSTTPSPTLDVTSTLDYETTETYTFTVIVTDKGVLNDGTGPLLTGTCSLTVTVDDVNEAPVVLAGQTLYVEETAAVGATLGWSLNATDPDNGGRFVNQVPQRQILSFRISTDDIADTGKFVFANEYSGMLTVNGALEADGGSAKTTYALQIGVSDGECF